MSLQFTSTVLNCVLNYGNKSAQIEKEKIKELLESWGRDILQKIPVDTAMNQIKYEMRTHRSVKELYNQAKLVIAIAVHKLCFKLCFKLCQQICPNWKREN